MNVLATVVAAIALVAAVPLGLAVGRDVGARAWRRIWPVVGVIGALSLVLPEGGLAIGPALFLLAGCLALALSIPARLTVRPWPPTELAVVAALATPLAGAVILVAELLGSGPAGALWWVASTQFAFTACMWAAARATGPDGSVNRVGVAGAALITWAALLSAVAAWWIPAAAAIGGAVLAAVGMGMAATNPARPPEPCSAQLADESTRLGG